MINFYNFSNPALESAKIQYGQNRSVFFEIMKKSTPNEKNLKIGIDKSVYSMLYYTWTNRCPIKKSSRTNSEKGANEN